MPKVFITATPEEGNAIHIKADSVLLYKDTKPSIGKEAHRDTLIDILLDNGYSIKDCPPAIWDYWIEYGHSYEINDEFELEEFKELNDKVKDIKNG